jgi:hypothetical protein
LAEVRSIDQLIEQIVSSAIAGSTPDEVEAAKDCLSNMLSPIKVSTATLPTSQPTQPVDDSPECPPQPSSPMAAPKAMESEKQMEPDSRSNSKAARSEAISGVLRDATVSHHVTMSKEREDFARLRTHLKEGSGSGLDRLRPRNALYNNNGSMSNHFELFFGVAILISALLSGVEVQYKSQNVDKDMPAAFAIIRHVLATLFLIEFVIRIWMIGPRHFFFGKQEAMWAWLDLGVVVSSLLEAAIDIASLAAHPTSGDMPGNTIFRNVRLVRMVRLARAFRLHRIIRFVSALRTLVYSILATLRSLLWAMVLLGMIIYVFGLAFTMEALDFMEHKDPQGEHSHLIRELSSAWGSLDNSMFTLFQAISGGVSWRDVVWPLERISLLPAVLFTIYIAFVYFAVLNVVTGVFCSSAIETTQRNPDLVARTIIDKRRACSEKLQALFGAIDDDDSGLITIDELELIAEDDMVKAYFQALEIDFRDAWTLFKLIDTGKDGVIKREDFLKGCEKLRGGATSMEMAEIGYDMKKLSRQVEGMQKLFKKDTAEVKRILSNLESPGEYSDPSSNAR